MAHEHPAPPARLDPTRGPVLAGVLAAIALACVVQSPAPADAASRLPGDRLVDAQWQFFDGGIEVRSVWGLRVTGGPVVVAVVDSGADLRHEDLRRNLWRNPHEIAGNGIDDDANGYVDDVHGADVVDGDGDPTDTDGHGTHVAGIIAARGNNGRGITGVAWRARIMPVRVLDDRNTGTTSGLAAGIRYAARMGARVINVSANSPSADPAVDAAIAAAGEAGALVVTAAGNIGADLQARPSYPACSPAPNVVTVASSGDQRTLSVFSSYGGACVDLTAPGEDILSTRRGGGYEVRTGTSMAAPLVSGAAVLLLGAHPRLTVASLSRALLGGARPDRTAGSRPRDVRPMGAGTLSVARALRVARRG